MIRVIGDSGEIFGGFFGGFSGEEFGDEFGGGESATGYRGELQC
jgi:hypothetical protein